MFCQVLHAHQTSRDGNHGDLVSARGADVVRMISDQSDLAILVDPALLPCLTHSEADQAGAILGLFGERTETEVRSEARVIHLSPTDATQISCDQSDGCSPPVEAAKQFTDAGTD